MFNQSTLSSKGERDPTQRCQRSAVLQRARRGRAGEVRARRGWAREDGFVWQGRTSSGVRSEGTAAALLRPRAAGQRTDAQQGIAGPVSESTCTSGRKAARDSRSAGWAGSETRRGLAAPGFCNATMRSCSARWCPCRRGALPSLRVGLATPESYLTAERAGAGGARQRLRR